MPIVHFANDFNKVPVDAVNVKIIDCGFNLNDKTREERSYLKFGPYCNITWDTHVGKCIKESESNMYHDSDFYMTVWNDETNKAERICFATTRGWSYPSYASRVDATDEVLVKYRAYCDAKTREYRILGKMNSRKEKIAFARLIGESNYTKITKLKHAVPAHHWNNVVKLMDSKLRSEFKKSLKNQILAWYFDPNPKYNSPLSNKQWEYV